MDSNKESGEMTCSKSEMAVSPPVTAATTQLVSRWTSDLGIYDFILRICAAAAAVAAAVTLGTATHQPWSFTGFLDQLNKADDNFVDHALTSFVFLNVVAAAYVILSLPFSIMFMVRPNMILARATLLVCDATGVFWETWATFAAGIAIYKGSLKAKSVALCQHLDESCLCVSWAVVASSVTAIILVVLFCAVVKKKN